MINRIIQPYLFFNGRCEQAVEFYRKALGAEVEMMMRFKESPEPPKPGMVPPGSRTKDHPMQKITPFLWFNDQAEEAAKFWNSIFKNSMISRS